jgi:competence protein ComEC
MQAVRDRKVDTVIPAVGDAYTLGRMTFEILGSPETSDNLNNRSLIVRLTFGENSFLFMGDTEADVEKYLVEQYGETMLNSDFIKVGHHGSNTSSSEDFIRAVSPAIAAISCGAGNEHGHPHREILERLADFGTETILRTDQNGTFVVSSNGHELSVRT